MTSLYSQLTMGHQIPKLAIHGRYPGMLKKFLFSHERLGFTNARAKSQQHRQAKPDTSRGHHQILLLICWEGRHCWMMSLPLA